MTDKEKEAIKFLKNYYVWVQAQGFSRGKNDEAFETVLNLIQTQQAEIEKYKYLYQKALYNTIKSDRELLNKKAEIEKKDKIIDEMAYEISEEDENFIALHINEIKQYFERKVENGN